MADKNAAKRKKAIEKFDREKSLPGGFERLKAAMKKILATQKDVVHNKRSP
jgi:hypothetical protein